MDVDSRPLNESALKLALEIMYLLTGEVYVIIRKLGEGAAGGFPHVSEGWSLAENTLMVPSLHSVMHKKNTDEKVLELTKKIIALLTREVPMRSQDVTVYFSMEEWEYLEGHKDLYKDIMMENHQTLTCVGGSSRRNTEPETNCRVPHYQEVKKDYNGSRDPQLVLVDGVLKRIKVEVEDTYQTSFPPPCKEEEVPTAICPEASSIRNTLEGWPSNPYLTCKTEEDADFFQRSPQSHHLPPRSESIFRDLIMYTERNPMNKRILELTMEIIYLLSRGEYVILKSSGEHVIPSGSIHGLTNQTSTQSSLMLPTPNSLTHELHNDQKILEVTNKLIELLTGEVSMRCQDVTVYFSLEEWEYFEQHKELYMKRLTSPGHRASQGFMKTAPCRNPTPYGQQNTIQGDTDYSDSEETVSDSEDYEDDESQSDTETEDEVPLSKINDPDLQVLLNRLRKMVKESEDYNPLCFQNDPEWGPGF
ncbi:uncharacterized protein LOC121006084 isoform X1 [Bufo bufo]|uniref:uncharacterized protein LOC121006084 isoform X1 n=1 Tax=Bufo bufo TaxID=8384 RepID=UPI001ABEC89A|nr:uncharacterized protein LOC121006084 isoform X1 [Bufo bufo]XP_040294924.1 uncharacterized protein LOC121006084 isoform X1 [Bufo bufo]XP_040294925.1 uncharacterized protein LOC121006084 isoform X1 [Bufo bufo]XP_040294926.1 uncharacterized protein LOC121006084 isoform X1 [Bufo bufo]